jgi:hypothetical protein
LSSTESFRPRPKFGEEEVFGLIGKAENVIRLEPANFDGPIAAWANDRMRIFSETIVPKEVYVEQQPFKKEHRVAWVYHEGFSSATGEPFAVHHVACDCSGDVDQVQSFEEKQLIISECPGLMPVIDRHADLIDAAYHTTEILAGLNYTPGTPLREQGKTVRTFVRNSILGFLEHDYTHPESWMANIESGWTISNLMAKIFKLSPEDIDWEVEGLAASGEVDSDGVHFGLSERHKKIMDLEKALRESPIRLAA